MVFSESALKDVYRRLAWGPWRHLLETAPAGWEIRANRALGRAAGRVVRGRRAELDRTLREALGTAQVQGWVDQAFATHFANQYVGFSFQKVREDSLSRYLSLQGLERLDAALAQGRGAVLAHPHMGLPQLPLHALGLLSYDVHQVGGGRPEIELSPVGREVAELRDRLEERIHATLHDGGAYLRPVLRALEGGGVVLTACDGTGGGRELGRRAGATVLGRTMRLPVFPIWLARRTGAVLLPLATHRSGGSSLYQARIEAPIDCEDEDRALEELASRLEEWLRQWPGDWHFWDAWHDGEGGLLQ